MNVKLTQAGVETMPNVSTPMEPFGANVTQVSNMRKSQA